VLVVSSEAHAEWFHSSYCHTPKPYDDVYNGHNLDNDTSGPKSVYCPVPSGNPDWAAIYGFEGDDGSWTKFCYKTSQSGSAFVCGSAHDWPSSGAIMAEGDAGLLWHTNRTPYILNTLTPGSSIHQFYIDY
jgi:hypothetical protein